MVWSKPELLPAPLAASRESELCISASLFLQRASQSLLWLLQERDGVCKEPLAHVMASPPGPSQWLSVGLELQLGWGKWLLGVGPMVRPIGREDRRI